MVLVVNFSLRIWWAWRFCVYRLLIILMVICNDWLPIAKEAFMYVNLKPFFVHYSVSVLIKKFPLINSNIGLVPWHLNNVKNIILKCQDMYIHGLGIISMEPCLQFLPKLWEFSHDFRYGRRMLGITINDKQKLTLAWFLNIIHKTHHYYSIYYSQNIHGSLVQTV